MLRKSDYISRAEYRKEYRKEVEYNGNSSKQVGYGLSTNNFILQLSYCRYEVPPPKGQILHPIVTPINAENIQTRMVLLFLDPISTTKPFYVGVY
jgi:hypothetical protein